MAPNGVDRAMDGWAQLSQNPDKMQEVMDSFKDPEVLAKAQEMLKDPQYMAAAKRKVAELQAKAQARGLLDNNGQPVPGNMEAVRGEGVPGGVPPSELEMQNIARHAAGELNDAELGMANLQNMAKDPNMLKAAMNMFKDPNTLEEVKKMMADPGFKAQAEAMVAQMKAAGSMPDLSAMAAQMGGMGGMGGGMGGGANAELLRLQRENAALKQAMGVGGRDEL